ncbi:MAG: DnaA N-terminal domain-containing protein, partial [Victivallales bacterium]
MPNDIIEEQVWVSACKNIENEIKDVETLKRWIYTITPLSFKNGILMLGVTDDFTAGWLRVHFEDIIANAFKSVVSKNVKVKYETGHVKEMPAPELKPEKKAPPAKSHHPPKDENHSAPNCNPKFTFGTFVVGPENSLAYEAAMSVL